MVYPLGSNVLRLREQQGLTREKLAKESGVSVGTLKNIENGCYIPAPAPLARLAEALEVDALTLLAWPRPEQDAVDGGAARLQAALARAEARSDTELYRHIMDAWRAAEGRAPSVYGDVLPFAYRLALKEAAR